MVLLQKSEWIGEVDPHNADNGTTMSIGDAVARSARLWPDAEAAVYSCQAVIKDVRWTFAELDRLTSRLACALIGMGYHPQDRIAIWAPNHPNWILLEYAIAKAGMVVVALNPLYREVELQYALTASNVVAIFHDESASGQNMRDVIDTVRPHTPLLRGVHHIQAEVNHMLQSVPVAEDLPAVDADSIFMIQYTSGTTGKPKAAWLPHGGITAIAAKSYQRWDFGAGDRVCHGFPLYHVGGSGNSTPGSLIVGTTTLPIYIFKASEALDILERERCTGFIGVPSMLTAMMENPSFRGRDFSALKRMVLGGASVPTPFLKRCEDAFGIDILNGYGQTESCGVCASVKAGDSAETKAHTSGVALPGVSMKVVGPDGEILPCGAAGELCVNGRGKMLRYGDDQTTMAAFDAEGWLRTGDIATMDEQGYISIVGRIKEMIIRGGENLYPAEIESHIIEHPDVAEVAVIGLPDRKYGEELCAVIRPASQDHSGADEIRSWLQARVSRWKVPRYVAFVDTMPATSSGKIKKHELVQPMIEHFALHDSPNSQEN